MQNEVFVPLPYKVEPGDVILDSQLKEHSELYSDLKAFCEQSFTDKFELDKTIYARGIRVLTDSHVDVDRLTEWLDN